MPSSDTVRLAVLIDADNTSPKHAKALLEEVAKYGVPTVKRAYGDWTNSHLSGWLKIVPEHAIQPMLQVAHTTGKNSTDSALIIDAMDLLYSGNVDAFALVSSDSDFTSLAMRLRESGKTVYGLGLRKTPKSLVNACNRFIFLEVLGASPDRVAERDTDRGAAPVEPVEPGEEETPLPQLRDILTAAIHDTSQEDGWSHLGAVGSVLGTRHASFDPRNYGFSKLISLARGQDYVEVEQNEGAPRVRLLSDPPATKAVAKKVTAKRTATKKAAVAPATEPTPQPDAEPVTTSVAKSATKPATKSATTRTRTRSTKKAAVSPDAQTPPEALAAAAVEPAETPETAEVTDGAEPTARPANKVTTRKRSSRSAQTG